MLVNYSSPGLLFSLQLFLKTCAILPDTHSIIPAGVTKFFKLQSEDIEKLLFEHIH